MFKKINNPEILRYRNNGISFWFCILAIVVQCVAFISIYSALTFTAKFNTGLDIVINILFLLVTFLVSEKVKTYKIEWGVIAIIVGLINLIRIYTYLYNPTSGEFLFVESIIAKDRFIISLVSYILVAVLLTASGIFTIIRGNRLKEFLNSINKEGK